MKPDAWIKRMALECDMIKPFVDHQVKDGNISYGLSSAGYDIRLSDEFKVFSPKKDTILNPKKITPDLFADFKGPICQIPANSFVLGRSLEYFKMPKDILATCLGKSTYARCGVAVNVTPLEPGWEGYLTMAINNISPVPVCIYANEGIAQLLFFETDGSCEVSYKQRKSFYDKQKGIVLSKV